MDKRQQLYKEISEADDLLIQLLLDTAKEYKNKTPEACDNLLAILNDRREAHVKGKSKSYTREQAFSMLKKGHSNDL